MKARLVGLALLLAGNAPAQEVQWSYRETTRQVRYTMRYDQARMEAELRKVSPLKIIMDFPDLVKEDSYRDDGGGFFIEVGPTELSPEEFYATPSLEKAFEALDKQIGKDPLHPPRVYLHSEMLYGRCYIPSPIGGVAGELRRMMMRDLYHLAVSQQRLNKQKDEAKQ